jgi:hypothetical protein
MVKVSLLLDGKPSMFSPVQNFYHLTLMLRSVSAIEAPNILTEYMAGVVMMSEFNYVFSRLSLSFLVISMR